MSKDNVTYEITKRIGVLDDPEGSYRTELNLIRWNRQPEKYDLRTWYYRNGEPQPLKGIALSREQMDALKKLLNESAGSDETPGQLSLFE